MESHPYWKPRHIWPAVHIRLLGWMFHCVTLKAVHLTAFSIKGCSSVSLQCLQRWQSCCHHNTRICFILLTFQQDHHWSEKMWHLLWPCWLPAWWALWLLWWLLRDAAMFQCVNWYQQSGFFWVFFLVLFHSCILLEIKLQLNMIPITKKIWPTPQATMECTGVMKCYTFVSSFIESRLVLLEMKCHIITSTCRFEIIYEDQVISTIATSLIILATHITTGLWDHNSKIVKIFLL